VAEITIRISDRVLKIAGILLAAVLLAWVWPYLWASGIFVPKYRLFVYVPEVSGLGVGAPVSLDGVPVGSIAAIKLAEGSASPERRIQLTLRIDRRYQDAIRSDSVAMVSSEGLLGGRYVSIHRGFKGRAISANGEIPAVPSREVTFKSFTDSLGKMVDCLQAQQKSAENKTQVTPETPPKTQP
jgi:phospholipid/cholesterol/gamma-HCH transport system substrate-binding protein